MKVSAVVHVRDGAATIAELYRRLSAALAKAAAGDYEIVFVNDGSGDHSWPALQALAWTDPRVAAVDLFRVVGWDDALACGFAQARGDIVVALGADLNAAPEEIPTLLGALEERGLDVVYGVPAEARGLVRDPGGAVLDLARRRVLGTAARVSAFLAVRREIASHLAAGDRSAGPIEGSISWLTSRVGDVAVKGGPAAGGGSPRATGRSLARAVDLLAAHSLLPLRLAALIGALLSVFGLAAGVFFVVKKLLFGIPVTGYASLIVSISIFSGVQLLALSLVAAYLARVHASVSPRPRYAIRALARAPGDAPASGTGMAGDGGAGTPTSGG